MEAFHAGNILASKVSNIEIYITIKTSLKLIFESLGMNLSTSFVGVREKMKEDWATQILNKLTC